MSDGTLSIRRRDPKASEVSVEDKMLSNISTVLSDINIGNGLLVEKPSPKQLVDSGEQRMKTQASKKLKEYDKFLKNFKYSAALDSVLKKVPHLLYISPQHFTNKTSQEHPTHNNILTYRRTNT